MLPCNDLGNNLSELDFLSINLIVCFTKQDCQFFLGMVSLKEETNGKKDLGSSR